MTIDTKKPHKGKIRSWRTRPAPGGGYVVIGQVLKHPTFPNGPITTSRIVWREGREIETLNSRYTLVGGGLR